MSRPLAKFHRYQAALPEQEETEYLDYGIEITHTTHGYRQEDLVVDQQPQRDRQEVTEAMLAVLALVVALVVLELLEALVVVVEMLICSWWLANG